MLREPFLVMPLELGLGFELEEGFLMGPCAIGRMVRDVEGLLRVIVPSEQVDGCQVTTSRPSYVAS